MELFINELKSVTPNVTILMSEPMSKHTTFRIGGPVKALIMPNSYEEAESVVKMAVKHNIKPFFLGNGSNLLVADEGVDKVIINTSEHLNKITITADDEIIAESGAILASIAVKARNNSLTGMEFAHGIPGTLGGAVVMNAGAYNGEMRQIIKSVEFLDEEGNKHILNNDELDFSYRHSYFSNRNCFILRAVLKLKKGNYEEINARMEELKAKRNASQPLNMPSAGSMFKRPANGYAAAMIDSCGLKGFSVGGAQVSEKHAGFVVNKGNATCADVLDLVSQVQQIVQAKHNVLLEMEVKTLGSVK